MPKKAVLAGGRGFLGSALAGFLRTRGWEIVVLTRQPGLPGGIVWDGKTPGPWVQALDGVDVLVNLTGRSVNCVPTAENRRQILESRLDSVRVLAAALARCPQPPKAWVQVSAIGYYGNREQPACDEQSPPGSTFLAAVCAQWEEAFVAACPAAVRPVVLRLGMVLDRKGGALPLLTRLTRGFLGGAAGGGRQGISWIHRADLLDVFRHAIDQETVRGVYNACAPVPVSNAEFMRTLRRTWHRPWCPPAPAALVALTARGVLRTDPSLVLDGQFAVPARLLAGGFRFKYARLPDALDNLAGRTAGLA